MTSSAFHDPSDLAAGLRARLADAERSDAVAVVPELQRIAREHLGVPGQGRVGRGDGATDIRVRAWSVGRIRRSARQQPAR